LQNKKKILFILAFTLILSSISFSSGLIEGGSFEDADPSAFWSVGVCGKDASPPINSLINRGTRGTWVSDDNGVTDGSLAGVCGASATTGTTGSGDNANVCITTPSGSNRNCTTFTNDAEPFPAEFFSGVTITLTHDYGSDFNVLMYWDEPADTNFFSVQYAGSTELNNGSIVTLDVGLCKAGGTLCGAGSTHGNYGGTFYIDNIRTAGHTLTVNEPIEPINSNTSFEIRATVTDLNTENVEGATVNITLNGDTNAMTYSNGAYRITYPNGLPAGSYDYNVGSSWEGIDQNSSGTLIFSTNEYQYLTITPIKNILSYSYGSVDFIIGGVDPDLYTEWRADSNSSSQETPTYTWFNTDNTGRQYFIYTSSDGVNYAFDATLTYGSTNSNPVQKIWNESKKRFDYSFSDTLSALETKYYRLEFRLPVKRWEAIGNSEDWYIQNKPVVIQDVNKLDYDDYTVSAYSGIRNIYKEHIPEISGDETQAYELQFTAKSDVNATIIEVGQTINGTDSGKSSASLTSAWHRYSFTIQATDFDSQILIINSQGTTANIQITDYALIPRGFFTKRLDLRKLNGDYLDLLLVNGFSNQYLQEGNPFRITTGAYDRAGNLLDLRLEAYFESVSANNLVKKSVFDFYETGVETEFKIEKIFDFDEPFPEIIDLNGNASNPTNPRNLVLKANIYDENGATVATQSKYIKFIQYPYFPDDLRMNFFPTEKRKGKNPTGILEIKINRPEVLEGLDLRIYSDSNTVDAPNFQKRIFKDSDFICNTSYCSLNIKANEYLFEDVNLTTITWFALLNTEYLDQDNNLTRDDRRIYVSDIVYDTAKIHQVVERLDRTYKPSEEIPLVLILRDTEAGNLNGKVEPYITLQNCDANTGGNCVDQTIRFKPTGFAYDDKFNYNYFFFRHLYVLDDGSLLPDYNSIGFRANVSDPAGIRTTKIPVLADKCQSQDVNTSNFWEAGLGFLLEFADDLTATVTGCNTAQYPLVTTTDNTGQETRLFIASDHTVSDPSQTLFACIAPDSNNVFGKPLEQDLLCFTWYEVAESPIDNFRIRLTNQFSDLSVEGSDRQYIEFNIPYEIIANNDVQLLKNQLETNQNTTIDTVGEFYYEGLRNMAGSLAYAYGLDNLDNFLASNNIITNVGADYDFSQTLSATTLEGAMFYRIKGVPVVNAYDYSRDFEIEKIYNQIDRRYFIRTLQEKDILINKKIPTIELIVNDFVAPIKIKDDEGIILIDEEPIKQNINNSNIDGNNTQKYNVSPNILNLDLQNTMFWNNFSENESRTISMNIKFVVRETIGVAIFDFVSDAIENPIGTLEDFLKQNLLLIMAVSLLLVIGGVIYWLYVRG